MELKKMTQMKLMRVFVASFESSTISATFTFLVSVLLWHLLIQAC